jgi:hypothetical protein
VPRAPAALEPAHCSQLIAKIHEAVAARQKAQDEATAEAPAPALAGGGHYLPVVLVDVANHLDDLAALDRAGIKVCSIYTVRPHGPQTTRKKGAAKGAFFFQALHVFP